jgi:hypothetical protein
VVATGVAANTGRTAARACSFTGTTLVLMADDTRKPIADVKVGDRVLATDPETGEQVAKTVEHVWVHEDTVIDLIVDGEVITTTEDHPFWSVTDQRFERADELANGENVLGADGTVVTVSGLKLGTGREARAYNLTVERHPHLPRRPERGPRSQHLPQRPRQPFSGVPTLRRMRSHLQRNHGLDPNVASNRLHVIKRDAGLDADWPDRRCV